MTHVYIASQQPQGAILHGVIGRDGIRLVDSFPAASPVYFAVDGDRLYALLDEPFPCQSGLMTLAIRPDGSLKQLGEIESTRGAVAAYVLRHRGRSYAVNYMSGTTIRLPDKMAVHLGRSVHPTRQEASHPHCIIATPDGERLIIPDLGTDKLYVTDLDLNPVSELKLPDGAEPRHAVFSPDGTACFCVCELSSTLYALRFDGDRLFVIDSNPTLPQGFADESTGSAVRVRGEYVYASNRGHDSIAVLRWDGQRLIPIGHVPVGQSPREFNLCGDLLVCGNDGNASVTVYRIGADGVPTLMQTLDGIPHPWGVAFWRGEGSERV